MLRKAMKIIFLAMLLVFLNHALASKALAEITGQQVEHWWCDNNGKCYNSVPSGGSSSSSYTYNENSGPAQLGRAIRQGIISLFDDTPPPLTPQQKRAREINKECNTKYWDNKDYANAVTCYEQALSFEPNNEVIQGNLRNARQAKSNLAGIAYYNQGDYEMAIKSFQETLSYGSNENAEYNIKFIKKLLKENERRKAEQTKKEEARQLNDNECIKYRLSGDFEKSFSCYEKALSLDPTNTVIQNNLKLAKMHKENIEGLKYVREGNWPMAIKYFKRALAYSFNKSVENSLVGAEGMLKFKQLEKIENARGVDLSEAKGQILKAVSNLVGDYKEQPDSLVSGASSSLGFIDPGNQPTGKWASSAQAQEIAAHSTLANQLTGSTLSGWGEAGKGFDTAPTIKKEGLSPIDLRGVPQEMKATEIPPELGTAITKMEQARNQVRQKRLDKEEELEYLQTDGDGFRV